VRLLIEKGANVNAKKVDGTTALGFAISLHNKEIEQMLRKAGARSGPDAAGEPNKKEAASASPAATTRK